MCTVRSCCRCTCTVCTAEIGACALRAQLLSVHVHCVLAAEIGARALCAQLRLVHCVRSCCRCTCACKQTTPVWRACVSAHRRMRATLSRTSTARRSATSASTWHWWRDSEDSALLQRCTQGLRGPACEGRSEGPACEGRSEGPACEGRSEGPACEGVGPGG